MQQTNRVAPVTHYTAVYTKERPMTPTPDDVRAAAKRIVSEGHYNYWECNWIVNAQTDGKTLARFADAVFNPPPDVTEAVTRVETNGYRSTPHSKELQMFADLLTLSGFIRSLITPATKEAV